MDRFTIQINYSNATSQAEKLDNAASQIENLANTRMEEFCNSLSANWQGENADKYMKKVYKVQKELLATGNELRKTATSIRDIAAAIYRADMAALELATKRNV